MLLCCVKKCFTNEQASFTMQKLKMSFFHLLESLFTCFLKDKTLHNHWDYAGFTVPYYNIPSNNRELQHAGLIAFITAIITYQVITGNYSSFLLPMRYPVIITYQVITGNYSPLLSSSYKLRIITYQVITGNYSSWRRNPESENIITYQVITGNYSVDSVQT